MEKVLEVKNVYFKYDEQFILEGACLDLFKGDYLGLIGPNGSAKSTLLKLILGILKPYKGEIQIFGQEIREFNSWEKVGYVSQKATSINRSFPATVEEILEAELKATNKKRKHQIENNIDINKVLDIVKIGDYKKRLIGNLSGGQQQKYL